MQESLNALGKELWSDLARKFMTDSACTLESILQVTLVEFRKNPWTNSTTFFGRILHEFLNIVRVQVTGFPSLKSKRSFSVAVSFKLKHFI